MAWITGQDSAQMSSSSSLDLIAMDSVLRLIKVLLFVLSADNG
jgi:hypothetical protein